MSPNIEQFTDKYEKTNPISRWLIGRFFTDIQAFVHHIHPSSILEVGCGPGFSTDILQKSAPASRIEACDIDEALVAMTAKRVPTATVQREDIHALTYPSHHADLVVCLEVLEHVENPEHALAELARVTRQYAIISVPHEPIWRILNMARGAYWNDWGNTPGHINHWSTRAFLRFVQPHFRVIATRTPLPWTILLLEKRVS